MGGKGNYPFVLLLGSVCPLVFPNMTNILKECGKVINNQTACCKAMESCVSIATAKLPHQLASLELCCIIWHEVTGS
jgi:hypothetical protein